MGWEKYSEDFLLLRRDPVPLVNIEHGCQNEVKGEMDNQEKKALKENFKKKRFLAKDITTVFLGQKKFCTRNTTRCPLRVGVRYQLELVM